MVYDTGGVRPAARALEVSHSSVSRHVRELEAWIGVALVQTGNGSRPLVFTAQGEALGRAGLASLRELDSAVTGLRERRRGNGVTVSTTPSFATRWLLPRLAALEQAHPWVELSVMVDQKLNDPTAEGSDIALRMGKGPWPPLACEALMDDALYPVMSPAYWEKTGRPETPGDLAGLRLLHDRDPQASWEAWHRAFPVKELDMRAGPRFASSDLVLKAAAQGLGVALARHRLVADDIAAQTLIRPCGDLHVPVPDAYWIVMSEGAVPGAAETAVIEWLKKQAAT